MRNPNCYSIAVLPGDGIGPEVLSEGLKVLRAIEDRSKEISFEFREYSVGAAEYLRSGDPLPVTTLEAIKSHQAILLGAMGLPHIRWPEGVEMTPQIDLREILDLYCGFRPIRLYHTDHSPLKNRNCSDIDLLIVRESTEGLFSSRLRRQALDSAQATDTMLVTKKASERLFRRAFREALKRRGHVTLVDKANVLPSMAFFRRIFDQVSGEFPDVKTDRVYVDAASLYLIQRPQTFDVLVTENMFGDILSDLAAGLIGGMGMAPSADIGDHHAVFQPSHGSAPDIAGKGVANPIATILSVAMMLDWLDHPEARQGAYLVQKSVERTMADPSNRTADLGGTISCQQMGDRITELITQAKF